jgi:heptosyltransferase III
LKKIRKILIIIQRSNGDVYLSLSLINSLVKNYKKVQIDLLVNEDTVSVAKLFPDINFIYTFSYLKKQTNQYKQEKELFVSLFKKYDLSINLTASDRSVIYALISGKKSISAIENNVKKSWWKKLFLTNYYFFDKSSHILINNLQPLNLLDIKHENIQSKINFDESSSFNIKKILQKNQIKNFIIFHPSTQYEYKVYPKHLRDRLLELLNSLNVPILVTGGNNSIDLSIKAEIPHHSNVYNFIGDTSLQDYFILSELALGYIGMDTLNMHIAASQNKRIFAIYGPTNLAMWSPWSNDLKHATKENHSVQTYGLNTVFQAPLPCVACGKAGCNDDHGMSKCLHSISPEKIFHEIEDWLVNV